MAERARADTGPATPTAVGGTGQRWHAASSTDQSAPASSICRAGPTLKLIAGSPQPVITAHRQMKTAGPLSGHDQAPAATPIIQI